MSGSSAPERDALTPHSTSTPTTVVIMHDIAFDGRDHAGVPVILQPPADDARDGAPDPG